MKIKLTESQIGRLITNEEVEVKYNPELNILSKATFDYTTGYYAGETGVRYIVGDEKPIGEFRIVNIDKPCPGFDLYDETPRNWFRCISMLGPILRDYTSEHQPTEIIFAPDGEKQQKRYQSDSLINYIISYIGDKYSSIVTGNLTIFRLK